MRKYEMKEEVGVPKDIEKAGEKLYYDILNSLQKVDSSTEITNEINEVIDFNTNLVIGNENNQLTITDVNLILDFVELNHNKVVLMSAGYNPRPSVDRKRWILVNNNDPKELYIRLSFGYPDADVQTTYFSKIIGYYTSNSRQIISSLTHELKHAYDFYVKPKESLKDFSHYMGITKANRYNLKVIQEFLHLLYLATETELLVKPSEVYSKMTLDGVNKTNFLNFLLKEETFVEFKQMRDFTYEKLINDIVTELDDDSINPNNVLRAVYVSMSQIKLDTMSGYVNDFFEEMLAQLQGVESKSDEFLEKYYEELNKYQNNPSEYFKQQVKHLNKVGDYMIKKIAKLYSIANEDSETGGIIRKIFNKSNPQK